jgi:hypothetical protein
MRLFERIKRVATDLAGSETKLATLLELPQQKLNGYLNPKSQKNLWEYLPRILELYPQVSRDWLYFGEGEMLRENPLWPLKAVAYDAMPKPVAGPKAGQVTAAASQEDVSALRQRVAELEQKLLASQEEALQLYRQRNTAPAPIVGGPNTPAPGARGITPDSEEDRTAT